MALERTANLLGQQRVDIPHLRAIESAVRADFDLVMGDITAGGEAQIVRGFRVVTAGLVGAAVSTMQVEVEDSVLIHPLASVSGGVYRVGGGVDAEVMNPTTNTNVEGSWTSGTTNYLGVDLRRESDLTTVDTVQFLDPATNRETPKRVPLAQTLRHRFVISTVDFSSTPHIAPIAIVDVSATGEVDLATDVTDARQMLFRLGSGGSNPDWLSTYQWPGGRDELSENVFTGGDREIGSLKEMLDALMTRVWELGGGEHWYSPTADRELKVTNGPTVLGSGDNWEWTVGTSTLQWADVSIVFGNSPSTWSNTVTNGSAVIPDGSCLYVDVDRTTTATLTAAVADLNTLGSPTIPGGRLVLAWRYGSNVYVRDRGTEVGRVLASPSLPVATTTTLGAVRLNAIAANPASPQVAAITLGGGITVIATSLNAPGVFGGGHGTGAGIHGENAATGYGGYGAAAANHGLYGVTIDASYYGVRGFGGVAGAGGVLGTGGSGGYGVRGVGVGTGTGVYGVGGATAGSRGVEGSSTATGGSGVLGTGTNGVAGYANEAGAGYGVVGTAGSGGTVGLAALAGIVDTSTMPAARLWNTSTSNGAYVDLDMLLGTDGDGYFLRATRYADDGVALTLGENEDGTKTEHLVMLYTTTPYSNFYMYPSSDFGGTLGTDTFRWRGGLFHALAMFDLNASTPAFINFDTDNDFTLPAATSSVGNTLHAANVCKAWAKCHVTCSTTEASVSIEDGYNITDVEEHGVINNAVTVTIGYDMRDANFAPQVQIHRYSGSGGGLPPAYAICEAASGSSFTIEFFKHDGSAHVIEDGGGVDVHFDFSFCIFGRQD